MLYEDVLWRSFGTLRCDFNNEGQSLERILWFHLADIGLSTDCLQRGIDMHAATYNPSGMMLRNCWVTQIQSTDWNVYTWPWQSKINPQVLLKQCQMCRDILGSSNFSRARWGRRTLGQNLLSVNPVCSAVCITEASQWLSWNEAVKSHHNYDQTR